MTSLINQFSLAIVVLILTSVGALAQSSPQVIHGVPGVAVQSAVVNFAELSGGIKQSPNSLIASPSPTGNFGAIAYTNIIYDPPDEGGAVGPNHVMSAVNDAILIQNKSGAVMVTNSLNAFWGSLSQPSGAFHPRLAFDAFKGRWIISSSVNANTSTAGVLVGVSQSNDPTGLWYLYKFPVAGSSAYADRPRLGFNTNWIVVAAGIVTNNVFDAMNVYALNKADLYAHGTGLYTLLRNTNFNDDVPCPAVTHDNFLATEYLIENERFKSRIRINAVTGPIGSETLTLGVGYSTNTTWSFGNGNTSFLPQLGTPIKIAAGYSSVQSCVYRNGDLWAAHTIFLPANNPTRALVQWWQVATNGLIRQVGRIDNTNGVLHFAYPSIAVNQTGDALIGYSRFSSNQYASANYSFRYSTDATNTMRDDLVYKAGLGPHSALNRWGESSAACVDPADDVTLWTLQEYAEVSGHLSWGTWWAKVSPQAGVILNGTALQAESCTPTNGVIDPGETVQISFTLNQTVHAPISNLVVSLQPIGGITSPSGPQSYGAMDYGSNVTRAFTFTAMGSCAGTITAILSLQSGSDVFQTITNVFSLGQLRIPLAEEFDSVTLPNLPAGWSSSSSGGQPWDTSNTRSVTASNSAHARIFSFPTDEILVSPAANIVSSTAQLNFRHLYHFDFQIGDARAAGVLEMALDADTFTDVLDAGCTFGGQGYDQFVAPSANPLSGRLCWGHFSGDFVSTTVFLPASAAGHQVRFRWRLGTDETSGGGGPGWYVDSVKLNDGAVCCQSPVAPMIINPRLVGGNFSFSFLSVSNQTYTVEYKNSLSTGNWATGQTVLGNGALKSVTNLLASPGFYRLRSP